MRALPVYAAGKWQCRTGTGHRAWSALGLGSEAVGVQSRGWGGGWAGPTSLTHPPSLGPWAAGLPGLEGDLWAA